MKNHDWVPLYCGHELNTLTVLTCEEEGFLMRLRKWSWVNGGIPAEEDFVRRLARSFQVSSYKFKKLWDRIRNFFTVRDGNLFYEDDEGERKSQVVNIAKSKYFGRLGAEKRWQKPSEPSPQPDSPPDSPPMATNIDNYSNNGEPPPPPNTSTEMGGGGGSPLERTGPEPNALTRTLSDADFQAICQRALDLGLAAPRRALAQRILEEFGWDIQALIRVLCKWEGQQHAGLWETKSRGDFELEAARQNSPRKPTVRAEEQLSPLHAQSQERSSMKKEKDYQRVMTALGRLRIVPFYPKDDDRALAQIAIELDNMCGTEEGLEWIVNQAVNNLQEWKGIAWMRERYCSKFKPADGIKPEYDDIGGERAYQELQAAETAKNLEQWKREYLALPESERAPIPNQNLIGSVTPNGAPKKPLRPLSEIYGKAPMELPTRTHVRTEEEKQAELEKLERELAVRRGQTIQ